MSSAFSLLCYDQSRTAATHHGRLSSYSSYSSLRGCWLLLFHFPVFRGLSVRSSSVDGLITLRQSVYFPCFTMKQGVQLLFKKKLVTTQKAGTARRKEAICPPAE